MPFDNDGVIKANSLSLVFFCSNDVFLVVIYIFVSYFTPAKASSLRCRGHGSKCLMIYLEFLIERN